MQVILREGSYTGDQVSFICCAFDFTDAVEDTDYTDLSQITGSYKSKDIGFLRFTVPLAGMDRLTGYVTDPASYQNIASQPSYSMYQVSGAWYVDCAPHATTLHVGTKPADWDSRHIDRYYTRGTPIQYGDATVYWYEPAPAQWDASTQYYQIDGMQRALYTEDGGFFGVSRYFGFYYIPGTGTRLVEVGAALIPAATGYPSQGLTISDIYLFKSGGSGGSMIFSERPYDLLSTRYKIHSDSEWGQTDHTVDGVILQQFCETTYGDKRYIGIVSILIASDGVPQSAAFSGIESWFFTAAAPRINYGAGSGINFGRGTFSDPSTPVGIPSIPSALTATDYGAGMHIRALAISDTSGQGQDVSGLFAQLWSQTGFWSMWQNIRFDPLSAIVSLHVLPTQLGGTSVSSLTIALTRMTLSNLIPASRIIDKSMGTIQIPEYYGNRLDYSQTTCTIFLPFIGDYPLDLMDVMGGSLSLTYRIDIATGDCVAFLLGTDRRGLTTISKEYKGNCAFRLPVSGSDNGGAGLMSALSSMIGGGVSIAAGNVVGGAASLIGGAVEAATAKVHSTAPQVQGSASSMGVLTPYIKIYRASQVRPDTYAEITADTAQVGGTITTTSEGYPVSGFTVYTDIDLTVQATQQEIDELRSILQGGIYV